MAKEIFVQYKVPMQQVVTLFVELYPKVYMHRMIEMFEVNAKDIPYYDVQSFKEIMAASDSIPIAKNGRPDISEDQQAALKEFLHYFIIKKADLLQEIDKLHVIDNYSMDRYKK